MYYKRAIITEIKDIGIQEVYDVQVEDDHSYISKGGFINHNSSTSPNLQNIPVRGDDLDIRKCFIPEEGHKLIVSDYCIYEEERVVTPEGILKLKDLREKEPVFNDFMEKLSIQRKSDRMIKPCFEITVNTGETLKLTEEHRIRVLNSKGEYTWTKVGDISTTDCIAIRKHVPVEEFNLGSDKAIDKASVAIGYKDYEPITIPTRLLGMMMFGKFTKFLGARVLMFEFSITNQIRAGVFETLFKRTFGKDSMSKVVSDKKITLYIQDSNVLSFIEGVFLENDSKDRLCYIPDKIYEGSDFINQIAGFVKGLFFVKGYVASSIYYKFTGTKTFVKDLQRLLLLLGVFTVTNLNKSIKRINSKEYCRNEESIYIPLLDIPDFLIQKNGCLGDLPILKGKPLNSHYSGLPITDKIKNLPYKEKGRLDLKTKVRNLNYQKSKLRGDLLEEICEVFKEELTSDEQDYLQLLRKGLLRFLPIISKEFLGKLPVYDIQLEGNHTFLTNGFISHNSQIELRLTAYYSKDPEMLRCYTEGIDIHSRTAQASFDLDCDVEDVKELHKTERKHAKSINFGLIYGMSPNKLSEVLGVPLETAKKAYDGYFKMYTRVRPFMEAVKSRASDVGYVKSITGRRRRVKDLPILKNKGRANLTSDDNKRLFAMEREVGNFVIQGSAADLMKRALILIHEGLKKYNGKLLMTIHDEVVISAPCEHLEEVAKMVKDCMENALPIFNKVVPIIAEPVICNNWAEGK